MIVEDERPATRWINGRGGEMRHNRARCGQWSRQAEINDDEPAGVEQMKMYHHSFHNHF